VPLSVISGKKMKKGNGSKGHNAGKKANKRSQVASSEVEMKITERTT